MQLERLKEYSKIPHPSILIPYTAGQVYPSQTFILMTDRVAYSWDTVSIQTRLLQNIFSN